MSDNFDRAGLTLAVFAFFETALLAWGAFATTQGVRSDGDSWLGGAALIFGRLRSHRGSRRNRTSQEQIASQGLPSDEVRIHVVAAG